MKAGEFNLLQNTAQYQITPDINFKDKAWKTPGKLFERFLYRIILITLTCKLLHDGLTYLKHCLS